MRTEPAADSNIFRYKTFEEAMVALDAWESQIHSIRHIERLSDGTFIVMGHINCEFCTYCVEKNQNRDLVLDTAHFGSGPHDFAQALYPDRYLEEASDVLETL